MDQDSAETPENLLEEGRFFSEMGKLDTAETVLRRALELGADPGEAHALLALTAVRDGRWRSAERETEQARSAGFRQPWLERMSGRIHFRRNRPDQALAAFRRALELEPRSVEAMYDCCCAELGHGERLAASALAARMRRTDPENPRSQKATALLALAEGDWPAAVSVLGPFIDSVDVEALNNLSLAMVAQERIPEARSVLRRAMDAGERTSYWRDLQLNRRRLALQTFRGLDAPQEPQGDRMIMARGGARPIVFLGAVIVTALLVRQTFVFHPLAGALLLAALAVGSLAVIGLRPGAYRALPLISEVNVRRARLGTRRQRRRDSS